MEASRNRRGAITRASRVIPAPPGAVYALLIDPSWVSAAGDNPVALHLDSNTDFLERVPNERVVSRHTVAPIFIGPTSWSRFGTLELERTFALEEAAEGTLLETETGWRFEPLPLHLFFTRVRPGLLRSASEDSLERLRAHFAEQGDENCGRGGS